MATDQGGGAGRAKAPSRPAPRPTTSKPAPRPKAKAQAKRPTAKSRATASAAATRKAAARANPYPNYPGAARGVPLTGVRLPDVRMPDVRLPDASGLNAAFSNFSPENTLMQKIGEAIRDPFGWAKSRK